MDLAYLLEETGDYRPFGSLEKNIQGIASDSREVKEGYLFVAYKGLKENGHKFISQAVKNGAVAVIGEEKLDILEIPSSVTYIQVKNPRKALALISSAWFDYPAKKLKVIGVTGTDGKTTTSTLIYEILKQAGKKVGLISTVAAYIGNKVYDTGFHVTSPDPYSLQKFLKEMVERGCEYAIVEVTSHAIDQERIGGIKFWVAVLTNITPEHLDYHKTFDLYQKTKMKLFKNVDLAVLNFDDPSFEAIKQTSDAKKIVSYSLKNREADFFTSNIKIDQNKTTFCVGDGDETCLETTLPGEFNISNTLAAISVARFMDIDWESLRKTLNFFYLPEGRLSEIKEGQDFNIVIDFAHTPNALESVLKFLRNQAKGKLIAVFGSAGERDRKKRPLMGLAASKYADLIVLTEEDPRTEDVDEINNQIEKGIREGVEVVRKTNREEAINYAIGVAEKDDWVGIFGKGHEKTINRDGTEEIPWSDKDVVTKAVKNRLNKKPSHESVNFKCYKHIHLTGIKGVAMTSLALCLQDMGIELSGSDTDELFVTDEILSRRKIKWMHGFSENNVSDKVDLVITTGAHGGLNNPECLYAKSKGIPVITHAQALGILAENKETIAVCGVGGKTTTSSMIANMLNSAESKPSFAIGVGEIFPLGVAGRYDEAGKCFVCEADEFAVSPGVDNRPRFSFLNPKILVVTNIEHDHPDIYPKESDVLNIYTDFFKRIPEDGFLVACVDNDNNRKVIKNLEVPIITYGFDSSADWVISDYLVNKQGANFVLTDKNQNKYKLNLKVSGKYNIENATAAFIVGQFYQIETAKLIAGLESFEGTKRRFEKVGETKNGALVYDDYAHHPKEIAAVIKMTKELYPGRRLIAVFQPHTYSRTKALLDDFAQSFNEADKAVFMDIYSSAREVKDPEVSSEILSKKVKQYQKEAYYTHGHAETLAWLTKNSQKGDIILTLGAGDIFYLHEKLVSKKDD